MDDVIALEGRLADRSVWRPTLCSVGRAMDVVGTRSAVLLMREAFYGTTRFVDFAARVGITEAVAATRLKELVDDGLLALRPYREPGQRTRQEYVLTDKGRDLVPAVVALMEWGDRYLAEPSGPPVSLRHRDCGADVRVRLTCAVGHEVELSDLALRTRPGSATPAAASQ